MISRMRDTFNQPRCLTQKQKFELAGRLTYRGPDKIRVRIEHETLCADCKEYAKDLADAIGASSGLRT